MHSIWYFVIKNKLKKTIFNLFMFDHLIFILTCYIHKIILEVYKLSFLNYLYYYFIENEQHTNEMRT